MKLLKRFARYFAYSITVLLLVLALGWVAATLRGDDVLDAGMDEFYHLDLTGYEKDNGAIAMLGLIAPASQTDSYKWALERISAEIERNQKTIKYAKPTLWETISLQSALQRLRQYDLPEVQFNTADYTFFNGTTKPIRPCLTSRYVAQSVQDGKPLESGACEGPESLAKLENDNTLLLSRYKKALVYTAYIDPSLTMLHGQEMANLQEVYLARLVVDSQTNRETALQKWLENIEFYNRAITGKGNLMRIVFAQLNRTIAQKALPALLQNDAALAAKYKNSLLTALRPIGVKDTHFEYEAKVFYASTHNLLGAFGNYNRNKFYRLQKEVIEAWYAPAGTADAKWKALQDKKQFFYLSDWHSPLLSMMTNLVMSGITVGGDLAKAIDLSTARSTMLAAYVQITAEHIAPQNIEAFLSTLGPEYNDMFTGKPFRYDPEHKMLYLINTAPDKKDLVKEGIFIN